MKRPPYTGRGRPGFTLIEVLAVFIASALLILGSLQTALGTHRARTRGVARLQAVMLVSDLQSEFAPRGRRGATRFGTRLLEDLFWAQKRVLRPAGPAGLLFGRVQIDLDAAPYGLVSRATLPEGPWRLGSQGRSIQATGPWEDPQ